MSEDQQFQVQIVVPVFNDWQACRQLLVQLDHHLASSPYGARVLLIDDGSTDVAEGVLGPGEYLHLERLEVLRLRRNLGHQRAICVGLAYADAYLHPQAILLMDADGEDAPADAIKLVDRFVEERGQKIVFAARARRSESWWFRICYRCYCWLHLILTGHHVRVGNFSVIPRERLASLVIVPELWSHYAAAVYIARLPFCMVPTRRAQRYGGRSKMNFVSLVAHGLAAISVFSETVGVRMLLACLATAGLLLAGMATVVGVRFFTDLAIPGWATYGTGLLAVLLVQCVILALAFSFMVLHGRNRFPFLPARDFEHYIDRKMTLFIAEPQAMHDS